MLKKAVDWVKEHPYALCLLYFIPYLLYFELLEAFAVPSFIIHCPIDDWIPFHEGFVIPYFAWFPMLAASLGYFLFHSRKDFLDLCFIMFSGMTICLLIYTVLPNGLQLRPTIVHDNLLARIASMLYAIDTPTNVCPSIHVSSTVAIMIIVMRYQTFSHAALVKSLTLVSGIAVCLSTVVLKQHSIIDVVLGGLLTLVLYKVCMQTNWRKYLYKIPYRKLLYRKSKSSDL